MKTKLLILAFVICKLTSAQNITANFSAPQVCVGVATQFTDLSTFNTYPLTSWDWHFGDNGSSTLQDPNHTYSIGTHTVTLIVTNTNGDKDSVKHTITVLGLPLPAFTCYPVCGGNPSVFTNTSAPYTSDPLTAFSWIF